MALAKGALLSGGKRVGRVMIWGIGGAGVEREERICWRVGSREGAGLRRTRTKLSG